MNMGMNICLEKKKRVEIDPPSFFIAHLLLGEVFLTALLVAITSVPTFSSIFAFPGASIIREGAGGILIVLSTFSNANVMPTQKTDINNVNDKIFTLFILLKF